MARYNYYYNNYTPHLFMDGHHDLRSNTEIWANAINNESSVYSPLIIELSGSYNENERSGVLRVHILAESDPGLSNLKLRVALIESGINLLAPNGTIIHNQTFRDMFPSTAGQSFTINPGETRDFFVDYSVPSPIVVENSFLVAFVQSDQNREILQGAKSAINELAPIDTTFIILASAEANGTIVPSGEVLVQCGNDTTFTITPDPNYHIEDVLVDNLSVGAVTSYTFNNVTAGHTISAYFHGACNYFVGDVAGDMVFNGLDVVYAVSYLKGGTAPAYSCECPPHVIWYVSGDVNASCSFNGLDVSYMVSYFNNGPEPIPCPDCAPAK